MGPSNIKEFAQLGANIEITNEIPIGPDILKEIIKLVKINNGKIKIHVGNYGPGAR